MLSNLEGNPNFTYIINALESAAQGNYSALVGVQQGYNVDSVVALPLECGDGGKYVQSENFLGLDMTAFQSTLRPTIRISNSLWT